LDGDGSSFEATIESSEQTGSETLLQARLADQEITILLRERFDTSLGNAHEFVVDAAAVHVFDTVTGTKIES
jgi:multiple sugar transport system ATP-binding protein